LPAIETRAGSGGRSIDSFRRKQMACTVLRAANYEVALDTTNQTRQKVIEVVDALLRQTGGSIECGILGYLSIGLGAESSNTLGRDPGPELAKHGVLSLKATVS